MCSIIWLALSPVFQKILIIKSQILEVLTWPLNDNFADNFVDNFADNFVDTFVDSFIDIFVDNFIF